ncbi:Clathrin/coatomer adaptor, adaptin-like protein [Cladochytrium replicatum]|nr:Clathrin/coatomer adaptor, adaptin-like protein [Cladochytrium replicatum]
MFEKSLTDLIRGIRANKRNEEKYIAQCLDEIRQEVKRNDVDIKANAVAKLAYLHTMGYSMNWASFHVVEVMSSPKFVNKRIGYAAAAQTFRKDTDVLMLVTNLIKKDMSSNSYLEAAQGLHGLAHIVNADLGRDLLPDLMIMLNHSRPYIRKRVILVLFRVFSMYPDALKIAFPRLREKLDDPDPSVVSAAVNVICELARMNPKSYLPLAPQLYGLLTNSSNNWMLIKIVKLFAALTPFEPRLAKKLAPSITNLIQTTTAMSLLFECIQTVITGGMISKDGQDSDDAEALLVKLCVSKLQLFVVHQDQNLKYLGLHALGKLQPLRPSVVLEHKTVIIQCLEDSDISIRQRALDLICGMVTKETLIPTTNRLMKHIDTPKVWSADVGATPAQNVRTASQPNTAFDATYRSEVVERILKICSADMYANVGNFDWYIRVLADLAHTPGISVSSKIGDQLMEVVARVPQVRPTAVAVLSKLLYELPPVAPSSSNASTSVLFSIAYILGEHSSLLSDALETLKNLMHRDNVKLDAHVQSTYLQSILKIVVSVARAEDWETVAEVVSSAIACLLRFEMTADLEVQERLLELLKADYDHVRTELPQLFDGALNPVAPKAQKKVPVPEGLLLDTPTSKKDQLFYLPSNSTTRGKDAEIDQIPIATLDFDLRNVSRLYAMIVN